MQRKRVLTEWVQIVLQNCEKLQNYRAKKEQILSEVCMIKKGLHIVLFTWDVLRKSMFKRLVYTPPDSSPRFTCIKLNLSNTKNPAWFFILASLLDRGMQRVNWLPPRTIVARVFLKIIFRGCPIIHSFSNGALWMPHNMMQQLMQIQYTNRSICFPEA